MDTNNSRKERKKIVLGGKHCQILGCQNSVVMVTTMINALRQMLPDKWVNDFRVPKTLTFKMRPRAQPFL